MSTPALFENQGFLVINGTQKIASEIVLRAAQRHATVVFTAPRDCVRDAERLVQEAADAGLSERVSFIATDLTDESAVEQLVDAAAERLTGLSVLIHNPERQAIPQSRPLVDISLDEWNDVLSTELRLPFLLSRRVVEEFLFAQAPGRIVFFGDSDNGCMPASRSTAQAGLHALVRCITKEFGRREIACNAVLTDVNADRLPAISDELIETILFFASRQSSFVNGEFLHVSSNPRDLIHGGTNGDR